MVAPSVKRRRILHLRKLAADASSAAEAEQEALLEARAADQRKAAAQKAAQEAAKVKAEAAKASRPRRSKKEEE